MFYKSSLTRRNVLKTMAALSGVVVAPPALGGLARALSGQEPASAAGDSASLGDLAAQKGILYGSSISKKHLSDDPAYAQLIVQQCKIVVPESEMKWKALRPGPDKFAFQTADWMVRWAESHDLKVRGTALVWHEALPDWFSGYANQDNARDLLTNHIRTVMQHYAGKIQSWDVVNEGLTDNGLRNTPWLRLIGPDYIDLAFRTAAEADPAAIRVYNDTNIAFADNDAKRAQVLKLLQKMLSNNIPVQALGVESHLRWDMGGFNPGKFRNFLKQVASLGLQIFITEIDVRERESDTDIASRDKDIADYYYSYLSTALEQDAVRVVISWGLTDRYTWLSGFAPRSDGQAVRPLPFDQNLLPTPAFAAVAKALENASPR
jgi:endo-1,4-beta-xylanase